MVMELTRLLRAARHLLPVCQRCHHARVSSALHHFNLHPTPKTPITSPIQPVSFLSDLTSQKYSLIYAFPAIRGMRALSRLKLMQTGLTLVLLPTVCYLYQQGQASLSLLTYSTGIAAFAGIMLYSISHYVRRVVGMMYLDSAQNVLKVSHLDFWGHRRDVFFPVSDVVTLGDSGNKKGEAILLLKRYGCDDVMYFSTRLGRVVDKEAFGKVFGSLT